MDQKRTLELAGIIKEGPMDLPMKKLAEQLAGQIADYAGEMIHKYGHPDTREFPRLVYGFLAKEFQKKAR